MNGVLLLNKPKGMTSHDCVFKIRKLLKIKKVGHTGTLDPDVSGVLPICIGRATKIAEYLTGRNKTYEGEVTLGYSTTTEDASGEIVERNTELKTFSRKEIENVLMGLQGEITQTPPMYSAVKVNGKKLYEYARAGIEVERPSRTINIFDISLLDEKENFSGEEVSFRFKVTCSKGTYVRTLAVTIGEKLGYPAHMSHLIRTQSGLFTLDQCYTFSDIEELIKSNKVSESLISIENALSDLPKIKINDTVAEKVKNGAILPINEKLDLSLKEQPLLILNEAGQCLAIYQEHPNKDGFIKPIKVLMNNQELI